MQDVDVRTLPADRGFNVLYVLYVDELRKMVPPGSHRILQERIKVFFHPDSEDMKLFEEWWLDELFARPFPWFPDGYDQTNTDDDALHGLVPFNPGQGPVKPPIPVTEESGDAGNPFPGLGLPMG